MLDLTAVGREGAALPAARRPGAVHIPRASLVGALRRSVTYVGPQSRLRWYDALRRAKPVRWRPGIVALGLLQLGVAVSVAQRWDDGGGPAWLLLAAVLGPTGLGNLVAGCTPARPTATGPYAREGNRP